MLQWSLNVCILALTGKLASTYAQELPSCQSNTVHTNYFIPIDKTKQSNTTNWSLANVHVLLVDKVTTLSPALLPTFLRLKKRCKTITNFQYCSY